MRTTARLSSLDVDEEGDVLRLVLPIEEQPLKRRLAQHKAELQVGEDGKGDRAPGDNRGLDEPSYTRGGEKLKAPGRLNMDAGEADTSTQGSDSEGAARARAGEVDHAGKNAEGGSQPVEPVNIPEDWESLHWKQRQSLAVSLGAPEGVNSEDSNVAIREELERREAAASSADEATT
jgi:hypothetical protein